MDRKNRTIIIVGLIVTFVVVPIATWLALSQFNNNNQDSSQPQPTERSQQELVDAIVQDSPQLSSDGEPTFVVSEVDQPQTRWYIVTVHTKDDPEGLNSAKILLYDYENDGGLRLLLGPGTSFPSDVTQPLGIPDSIAQELNS